MRWPFPLLSFSSCRYHFCVLNCISPRRPFHSWLQRRGDQWHTVQTLSWFMEQDKNGYRGISYNGTLWMVDTLTKSCQEMTFVHKIYCMFTHERFRLPSYSSLNGMIFSKQPMVTAKKHITKVMVYNRVGNPSIIYRDWWKIKFRPMYNFDYSIPLTCMVLGPRVSVILGLSLLTVWHSFYSRWYNPPQRWPGIES